MDEPTNDLDLETLELLEAKLLEFDGTLLLVSHDRAFLDNVVTNIFVLDGAGNVQEFFGGYTDWLEYNKGLQATAALTAKKPVPKVEKSAPVSTAPQKKKLSFKEQQELEKLPALISKLEAEQVELTVKINEPNFYKQEQSVVNEALDELKNIENELVGCYARWDELEENAG
jgi:ATP-binding cassette subfamily F protein uup